MNDRRTGTAGENTAFPAWDASTVHSPAATEVTVAPDTVHTAGETELNDTASPDDADADTANGSLPNNAPPNGPNEIDCDNSVVGGTVVGVVGGTVVVGAVGGVVVGGTVVGGVVVGGTVVVVEVVVADIGSAGKTTANVAAPNARHNQTRNCFPARARNDLNIPTPVHRPHLGLTGAHSHTAEETRKESPHAYRTSDMNVYDRTVVL
jgi:hypothetical protein